MPVKVLCAKHAVENNTGVVPSILAGLQDFLNPIYLFLLVSFEFASKELLSGMAVCWHAFSELDL